MTNMTDSLMAHWHRASAADIKAGRAWYREAKASARVLARRYGYGVETVAAVIAALSPNTSWKGNLTVAEHCLASRGRFGGMYANTAKARRIMYGARPLDVLGGPKVRAFYGAIAGNQNAVVCDRWIIRAAGGLRYADGRPSASDVPTSRQYQEIADAIKTCARSVGVSPRTFQATVWVVARGGSK